MFDSVLNTPLKTVPENGYSKFSKQYDFDSLKLLVYFLK